jgi:hypothetical protein
LRDAAGSRNSKSSRRPIQSLPDHLQTPSRCTRAPSTPSPPRPARRTGTTAGNMDRRWPRLRIGEQASHLAIGPQLPSPPRPAREGVEEDERIHRLAQRPHAAAEALPPPPALEATSPFILFSSPPRSARGRQRRVETPEPRRQQAVLELFITMAVDATAPCSGQRSSGAAWTNPSAQIWTPRSGAP